jgi:cell division protein FtsW
MAENTKGHIDWVILIGVAVLMFASSVFVYSASVGFAMHSEQTTGSIFMSHFTKVVAGFILMLVISLVDYKFWIKISKPIMMTAGILLFLVLISGWGHASHGAKRWINLGFVSFQPSEIAKVALVLHFSHMLVKNKANVHDFKEGFVPFLVWIGLFCLLIALQPNFSTMMVLFGISMLMLFVGGVKLQHLFITLFVGLLGGLVYGLSAPYRWHRIMAFLGFEEGVKTEVTHQIEQSLLAIGNGGFSGVGVGQSRQSHLFLPEAHSDFIFSIIGEEYGFIGLVLMLLLFAVIIYRGFRAAKNAPDEYGYFLGAGIVIVFAMYVIINAAVCINLLPTTGLPLPFISYGGTAILINAGTIGILLNISAQSNLIPRKQSKKEKVPEKRDEDSLPVFENPD